MNKKMTIQQYLEYSEKTREKDAIDNFHVNLFQQYFISPDEERQNEIKYVLKRNVENPYIHFIYLLNERIYSTEELGLSNCDNNLLTKIKQVDIGKRMEYKDFFDYIEKDNIQGYCILSNSDIFFDETIGNLHKTTLSTDKSAFALSRYEFYSSNKDNLRSCELVPTGDGSQDTWIIHSNFNLTEKQRTPCNFNLGKFGCDNFILNILRTFEYTVFNDPEFLKTYHYHTSNVRTYTSQDRIIGGINLIKPIGSFNYKEISEKHPEVLSVGNNYNEKMKILRYKAQRVLQLRRKK